MKPGNKFFRRSVVGVTLITAGAAIAAGAVVIGTHEAQQARAHHLQEQFEARHLAHFSLQEHMALVQMQKHVRQPTWRELSTAESITEIAKIALSIKVTSPTATVPGTAPFRGNATALAFTHTGASGFVLARQSDCSLSLLMANYTLGTSLTTGLTVTAATSSSAHYEQTLHAAAGLTTTADSVTPCEDPTSGFAAQRTVYLGKTTSGDLIVAGVGYIPANTLGNSVMYATVDPTGTATTNFHVDTSAPGVYSFATGDLNGDGRPDLVGVDQLNAQIVVWLTQADGTLSTPVRYNVDGVPSGAVVADVNGDDKLDVVVSSVANSSVSILTGNGDGTLNAYTSFVVPAPSQGQIYGPQAVLAADLRNLGYPDLVLSNGWVYRNNGSGTFTLVPTQAFAPVEALSTYGTGMVAADFNKDGKLDLALDSGPVINLYSGNGDDSFTAGPAYASIDNVGYVGSADLDSDGNTDLWSGLSAAGTFGGDQYSVNEAMALMGNGDGTFQGAPSLPFVFTGTNIADLNGDGVPDAIGVNAEFSMTSYLGSASGAFATGSVIALSPAPINGNQDTVSQVDGYAIADVTGDGKPDLVVSVRGTISSTSSQLLLLRGDGHGGFGAPTAITTPVFAPQGQTDQDLVFADIRLIDVNGDGKPDLVYFYTDQYGSGSTTYVAGTAVQLSNGDGTFHTPVTIPFYSSASSQSYLTSEVVTSADLNGDGKTDLIFVTQTSTSNSSYNYLAHIQVALGHGDGTFATPTTITGPTQMLGVQPGSNGYAPVVVTDMNGDGKLDIVTIGADSNGQTQVAVIPGKGDGTFLAPTLQTYNGQYLNGVGLAVADFNADGKKDVFISNPNSVLGTGIAFGNGDGTLQYTGDQYGSYVSEQVALSLDGPVVSYDMNGDGTPDVLAGSVQLLSVAGTSGGGGTTPADFSVSTAPTSATVTAGASATTTVSVTPTGGFTAGVALSCTGLPSNASCAFSPTTVTPGGAAATSTLTITTASQSASNDAPAGWLFGSSGTVLAVLFLPAFVGRSRRYATGTLLAAGAVACLLLISSCGGHDHGGGSSAGGGSGGGGTGTPSGTYTVTLSGVSGATTHTTTFSLIVN